MTRVLVAYASRHGATAEIAQVITDKLREFELDVDCVPAAEVASLDGYDAAVIGSAVYAHRWRHDALALLRGQAPSLASLPFWVFSSGPVGTSAGVVEPSFIEPSGVLRMAEELGARGHAVFGGRLPLGPQGPIERVLVARTPSPFRDSRDWGAIRVWAANIGGELEAIARAPSSSPRTSG